ncbi:MAG: hypothetical protein KJ906_00290 [Nanoarchaeota archaeon]|nr:hypothetical protein [Nanoarchaeota archaeon]
MAFKKSKKITEAEKRAKEKRLKEIEKIKKLSRIEMPTGSSSSSFKTREYKQFLTEIETKPKTWFELSCAFSEKIFPIKPDQKMADKLEENIKASFMHATPKGVLSFSVIIGLLLFALTFGLIFLGIGGAVGIVLLICAAGTAYYLYNYPTMQAKVMGMRMSSDTVLAVLYMVIYMRTSPNLEGALKFAAQHLKGPLSWDLKKLIWDIEVGVHSSADAALLEYVYKWKDKNKEFAEALHLLRGVAVEPSRRNIIFDETISVILNGTRERAKHYASGLRMPMMMIHAMGVLLPVMGLVMFPIVMIFMAEKVKPIFVFLGYDVLLPLALLFFTSYILQSKPPTFSQPDVSMAKGIPKMGYFKFKNMNIPVLPVAIGISLPLLIFGFVGINNPDTYTSVAYSMIVIFSLSIGIGSYCLLDSFQKMKIRKDIEQIEDEFSVALFQLGNVLASGMPIELAIDKARSNMKGLKIAELFEIISMNMKKFGYTFEQALFDKDVGAIYYYPSTLIQSIMQTIIESSKKSIQTASTSMIVVSNYLKNVHNVKEEIDEILGETITSMQFLAMFLAPMVAGVTVTMAVVILQILSQLGSTLGGIMESGAGVSAAQGLMLIPWAMGGAPPISPAVFQLIVGIYMVEMGVLLSMFLNQIKYGEDKIGIRNSMWSVLIIGILVYIISWYISFSVFGDSLGVLLNPVV